MSARLVLNQLRVQELKELCKEEGLDHNGSKRDLIQRLVEHKGTTEAEAAPQCAAPSEDLPTPFAETPKRGRGRGRGKAASKEGALPQARRVVPSPLASNSGGSKRGRLHTTSAGGVPNSVKLQCAHCRKVSEVILSQDVCIKVSNSFMCLECRVRSMDPFNPVTKCGKCAGILHAAHVKERKVSFSLDLAELKQWRKSRLQVEMRMLRLGDTKICQVWPHELKLSANGKEVFRIVPPQEGHKRRDVPEQVTPRLSQGHNQIDIEMTDPVLFGFAFAIVLTAPQEPSQLARAVPRTTLPEARARIQALLAKLQDQSEISCLTTDKLKLLCPLTMERVEVPVRGENCQHLQCFSLEAFLVSNSKMSAFNNRWVCPICSLVLRPIDLRVDAFVETIAKDTSASGDADEVAITADGTWTCSSPCNARPSDAASAGSVVSPAPVSLDVIRGAASSGHSVPTCDTVELEDDAACNSFGHENKTTFCSPVELDDDDEVCSSAAHHPNEPICRTVELDDEDDDAPISMRMPNCVIPSQQVAAAWISSHVELGASKSDSEWSCPQCTLINKLALTKCKVCRTSRPLRVASLAQRKRSLPVASPVRRELASMKRRR